jgi:hypothetical protein
MGLFSLEQNPIDAIPDLSENQVLFLPEVDGDEATDHRRPGYISACFKSSGYSKSEEHPGNFYVRNEFRLRDIR